MNPPLFSTPDGAAVPADAAVPAGTALGAGVARAAGAPAVPADAPTLPGGVRIEALPKVSLHDHLDGGLRPETVAELADAAGIPLPVDDPGELGAWFERQSQTGSLVDYLKTFTLTCAVMQTEEQLFRVAAEFVADLVCDGVRYAEIRWAPEQHLRAGLSLDDAVAAVQAGLDAGVDRAAAAGQRIRVTQLLCAMRHSDRSLEVAQLVLRHRDRGVVGFDLAGDEFGYSPAIHREAFELLARELMPATVHAGEAGGVDSIRSALLDGRALRLGHGVRVAEDIVQEASDDERTLVRLGELAHWVKDRAIALELAPSSNLQTGAIAAWGSSLEHHPFDLLYQLGFAVTVNPDNRLMSATSISHELAALADTFAYGVDDVEQFQLNAAAAAFLPVEDRVELALEIERGFDEARHAARSPASRAVSS